VDAPINDPTSDQTTRRIASLREQLADGRHLRFDEEIVPYVDGDLAAGAKEAVEAHLNGCAVCRREIDDLRELVASERRASAPSRARRSGVIAALAAAAAIAIGFTLLMTRPATTAGPTAVLNPARQPLTVALHDANGIIGIDRSGALHGVAIDPATAQRAAMLLANPELASPASLAGLLAAPGRLRGTSPAAGELAVVSPVGIATVEARPQFVWRGESSAPYQVIIIDGANEIRGETRTEQWTPPTDLVRGRTYTWQVSATIGERRVVAPAPPAPPALFRVVDQKTADAIAAAHSHLIAGMLAYYAGAIADARREFEQLAAANPDSSIPPKLIASCNRAMKR
jgi:hypothetical protein